MRAVRISVFIIVAGFLIGIHLPALICAHDGDSDSLSDKKLQFTTLQGISAPDDAGGSKRSSAEDHRYEKRPFHEQIACIATERRARGRNPESFDRDEFLRANASSYETKESIEARKLSIAAFKQRMKSYSVQHTIDYTESDQKRTIILISVTNEDALRSPLYS